MIRSMTGFGKSTEKYDQGKIEVEIKALNHKTLGITCNPFNDVFLIEKQLQEVFEKKIFRGKIFVKITNEEKNGAKSVQRIKVNEKITAEYLRKIKSVQKKLKIKGNIEIRDLINYPGVIEFVSARKKEDIWPYTKKALIRAVDKLVAYRVSEGKKIAKDFRERMKNIESNIKEIKKSGKKSVEEHRKKLIKSTKEIMNAAEFDKLRLETEVALFARNCDIAEEITRLSGHIETYKSAIKDVSSEVGKKLDFIAQEMQREANTIGAKSSDFKISRAVIEVKSQIEKMREQIRNIE